MADVVVRIKANMEKLGAAALRAEDAARRLAYAIPGSYWSQECELSWLTRWGCNHCVEGLPNLGPDPTLSEENGETVYGEV